MTLSRINPGGWSTNDELTSSQMNDVDSNILNALDKSSAGDTLSGAIELSGAGRFICAAASGPNADTTFTVGTGNNLVYVSNSVSANRTYTLSNSGATEGDTIQFFCDPSFAYAITVQTSVPATLAILGNGATSDGASATFIYFSAIGWKLLTQSNGARGFSQTFTSSGTFTCPRNVTRVKIIACGAGGGGAGGRNGSSTDTNTPRGGGGGGASIWSAVTLAVTPGTGYAVVIGTPGTGGTGGTVPTAGSDGTATSFGSGPLVTWLPGKGGLPHASLTPGTSVPKGGGPAAHTYDLVSYESFTIGQSCGGHGGVYGIDGHPGGSSGLFAGGAGGTTGSASTTYLPGGGGGGGGGGYNGAGGAGGAGGNANDSGAGGAGTTGGSAPFYSGAGGGGGGAGGNGTSGGAGANGGDGGDGYMVISWYR